MAQIPIVESSRVTPAAAPGALMSLEAAAAPYRALQGLGQQISQSANVIEEFRLRSQKAKDDAAALNAEIEWDKAKTEYDVWLAQNKDAGVAGEKHIQKAQEISNSLASRLVSDESMSTDAKRRLQQFNELQTTRFIDSAKVRATQQSVNQAKARHLGVIEYWTERGDRQQIDKSIKNMVANGLATPEDGEGMLKSALRNADLNEFNRASTSDDINVLNDMKADLEQGVLSNMTENDRRQASIRIHEQINRVQTQTANDLALELEDNGASAAWRDKLEKSKENGALNATAYRIMNKRALKEETALDVGVVSIDINTKLNEIAQSKATELEKQNQLFMIGPSIAALPSGPNKSILEQKYKDVLKPEQAKKEPMMDYLEKQYDFGVFGRKSATPQYVMKRGKKTEEVDEALTAQYQQEASDAYYNFMQAKAWLKDHPDATRADVDAFIRRPRDLSSLKKSISAISGL